MGRVASRFEIVQQVRIETYQALFHGVSDRIQENDISEISFRVSSLVEKYLKLREFSVFGNLTLGIVCDSAKLTLRVMWWRFNLDLWIREYEKILCQVRNKEKLPLTKNVLVQLVNVEDRNTTKIKHSIFSRMREDRLNVHVVKGVSGKSKKEILDEILDEITGVRNLRNKLLKARLVDRIFETILRRTLTKEELFYLIREFSEPHMNWKIKSALFNNFKNKISFVIFSNGKVMVIKFDPSSRWIEKFTKEFSKASSIDFVKRLISTLALSGDVLKSTISSHDNVSFNEKLILPVKS